MFTRTWTHVRGLSWWEQSLAVLAVVAILIITPTVAYRLYSSQPAVTVASDAGTEQLSTAIANGVKPTNDELVARINNLTNGYNALKKAFNERQPIDTDKLEKSITDKVLKNLPAGVPVSRIDAIENKQAAMDTKLDDLAAKVAKLNPDVASNEPKPREIPLSKQEPAQTEPPKAPTPEAVVAPRAPVQQVVVVQPAPAPVRVAENNPCTRLPGTHWSKFGGPQGGCVPNRQ